MTSSTRLILIVVALFSTLLTYTQAFCIYNMMETAGATVDVFDFIHEDSPKSFKKVIDAGDRECCHYSNTDCNPTGLRHVAIYFHGWMNHGGLFREGHKKVFKCDAGGALQIYGTSPEDARAVCYESTGSVIEAAIIGDL